MKVNKFFIIFIFLLIFNVFIVKASYEIPPLDYKYISIDLDEVNVKYLLKFLAKKMNYNIVIDSNVDKTIPLHLKHVPIFKAFDIILKLANLRSVLIDKKTFFVTDKSNITNVAKVLTKVVKLKYISPDLAKKYLQNIDVKVFPEQNFSILVIQGVKEDIKKAVDIIKDIDIKDFKETTKIFKLKNADALDVYNLIISLFSSESASANEGINNQSSNLQSDNNQESVNSSSGSISGLPSSNMQSSQQVNDNKGVSNQVSNDTTGSGNQDLPFKISVDTRSNSLIVRASKFYISKIEKIINSVIDKKVKQVLISVKVLEINKSKIKQLGLEWSSPASTTFVEKPTNYVPIGEQSGGGGEEQENNVVMVKDGLKLSYRTPFQIQLAIHAMLDKGWGKVLANPKITTWDRRSADILIGDRVPIVTQTVTQQLQGGGSATSININYIQVGTYLKITPYINDKNYITMDINPEVSSIVKYVSAFGQNVPQIGTRSAHARLTVKDGNTIVLGGLIRNEQRHSVVKVPILGDIPIIGRLFFTKSYKQAQNTEIIFLITPHIINYKDKLDENNKQNKNTK